MAPQFDHGFWSTNIDVPSWLAYRVFPDPTPIYEFHRRFVQVLQAGRPPTWLFKSPMHLSRLGPRCSPSTPTPGSSAPTATP